jgi:hypothetical protein
MKTGIKLFTISFLFLLISCSLKPRSWWEEGAIAVMADPDDWEAIQGTLRSTYERVVRTPQIENVFNLIPVSQSDFKKYTRFRYILLVATLKSEGKIGKIVRRVVSDPEILEGVKNEKYYVFVQRNQWAKDQLMGILIASDIAKLRKKIEENAQFLYAIFETNFNTRLTKDMFERGEQKKIEKRLINTYNWNIRIQRDYFIAEEIPQEGFIWFRRMHPERWIFIRWIAGGDTSQLDPYWVVRERNRITSKYYNNHQIVIDKYLFSYRTTFKDRPAQVTSGLWEHKSLIAGGPFKNYTFYDPLTRMTYMIDLAIFAPHRDKLPLLKRMEIIAQSFQTIFDNPPK